jgi:two-component system cell cycle sensor histidine kinase/response regulator CckA
MVRSGGTLTGFLNRFLHTDSKASMDTANWRRRILGTLGTLTAVATLAVLMPYILGGLLGGIISVFLTLVFLSMALATWLQLQNLHNDAREEVLLRESFHSVLMPQLITDTDGNLVMANRAFRGWIDLGSQSAQAAIAKRFSTTPSLDANFRQLTLKLKKSQSVVEEFPVIRGGRVVEWRRIAARQLEGVKGFYHWRFEDVTERRRMEKAMHDEQTRLLDFMANAPVGIYSVDQYGRFKFVNQTLATWLQVSPDDLIKGNVALHDIMSEPPRGVAAHSIAAGPHGMERGEVVLRRRNGQLFPVAITQTVVAEDDGKNLRTHSIVRDLSPEREWQQALSFSEYRFQRLLAEAPIGIVLLDAKFSVVECNQAFTTVIHRRREAIVNLPLGDLVVPAEKAQTLASLSEVLRGTDWVKPVEIHILSDHEVTAQVFAKRFTAGDTKKDGSSPEQGLMLYFIDATEQKKLEAQFAQSQKMQAIGQLAGGVAHDFNNLLTAMIGFCDLLLQRHKPGDQSFSDIMQIKQNGNRAANLVRQLLAFSRQQTMQPKVLNLVDVMSELTNLLRRLIGPQIEMEMIHGRDLALIRVDQGQLEQVIINLVVNARDAMKKNGGSVTIRSGNIHQDKPVLRGQDEMPPGDYVAVEVADTGTGIPKDVLPRIFEPFFSTKEIGSGTGLGLSTVYGIVRQTGGFIGVQTEAGKGTTFTLYFPAITTAEQARSGRGNIEDSHDEKLTADLTGAATLLLVEDEDAVRMFSSRALKNKGYTVLEARGGEEALKILEQEGDKIHIMITDVVMPEMDGPTLYNNMRDRWPKIKVIFMSGYTEDRLREQFTSGEEIYFLGKPFTLKQLAAKVKEVFDTN